jgi:hypothetical protein
VPVEVLEGIVAVATSGVVPPLGVVEKRVVPEANVVVEPMMGVNGPMLLDASSTAKVEVAVYWLP